MVGFQSVILDGTLPIPAGTRYLYEYLVPGTQNSLCLWKAHERMPKG